METDDKRRIDDPLLNQDSTYNADESFDDTDDFHKYDDTANSNLDPEDPIVQSEDATNRNAGNRTPTFTRSYDRNASDMRVGNK